MITELRKIIDGFELHKCGNDADGYNVSADHLATKLEELLDEALVAGWNACRSDIYALSDDIIEKANQDLKVTTDLHATGYYRGESSTAKSFARAFGSFEAKDADRLKEAREKFFK